MQTLARDPAASWLWIGAALTALAARAAGAQDFDPGRAAINDSTVFAPFRISSTARLRDALSDHSVDEGTPLLVFEVRGGPVALVTAQMSYHHVAQGEIAGQPWMVSF
jgi:hypothetical protein